MSRETMNQGQPASPITVVAAVLSDGERFLVTRRRSGRWEFPGGKVEPGEGLAEALVRELKEELTIEVRVGERLIRVEHAYPDRRVILHALACRLIRGRPRAVGVQEVSWLRVEEMASLDFLEADYAIIKELASPSPGTGNENRRMTCP